MKELFPFQLLAILATLPTVIVGKCPLTGQATPDGYVHKNGRYYKYESTMMRYSAAELACENDGAKLASVHSPNDLATIQYYLDRNRLAFWIGLKKVGGSTYCVNHDCNGMLRWADGTDFKLDPLSHPAVLADSSSTDCFQYDKDQRINDYSCGESMPSLCQYTCTVPEKMPVPTGDVPAFTHWRVDIVAENTTDLSVDRFLLKFQSKLPQMCFDECMKNCTQDSQSKCFGKVHHIGIKPQQVGNDTLVQVPCECGHSTAKRYPGRFCGPRRQACHRQSNGLVEPGDTFEGIWVDGHNTFIEEKSDHPRKPK